MFTKTGVVEDTLARCCSNGCAMSCARKVELHGRIHWSFEIFWDFWWNFSRSIFIHEANINQLIY